MNTNNVEVNGSAVRFADAAEAAAFAAGLPEHYRRRGDAVEAFEVRVRVKRKPTGSTWLHALQGISAPRQCPCSAQSNNAACGATCAHCGLTRTDKVTR